MPSATDRLEFGPPRERRSMQAFTLAILAHGLLLIALTWGVSWKRTDQATTFEAEIWSALPQQAAPRLVEPPPPPPPPPAPTPAPTPQPAPKVVEPPRPEPVKPEVDIALEQEKKRKLLEQKKEAEANAAELRKEKALAEKALEKEREKELKAKEESTQRKATEEAKRAETKKQEARERELEKQQQQQQKLAADAAAKKRHDDEVKRIMGLAGASGGAEATGSAQRSSGPSASYGGKVAAKVKPNILLTEDVADNISAEVEVTTTPDGTIVGQRLAKSSGNKAWDDAVIKAIIRTETMPRDGDGRVPSPMILKFRPRELL